MNGQTLGRLIVAGSSADEQGRYCCAWRFALSSARGFCRSTSQPVDGERQSGCV